MTHTMYSANALMERPTRLLSRKQKNILAWKTQRPAARRNSCYIAGHGQAKKLEGRRSAGIGVRETRRRGREDTE